MNLYSVCHGDVESGNDVSDLNANHDLYTLFRNCPKFRVVSLVLCLVKGYMYYVRNVPGMAGASRKAHHQRRSFEYVFHFDWQWATCNGSNN